jgi:hypothetical protein
MRKLTLALAFSSVALAGTTVYFAQELSRERAKNSVLVSAQSTSPPPVANPAAATVAGAARRPASIQAVQEPEALPRTARISASDEDMRAAEIVFARNFLEQLADPQARADMIAERRMVMRQSYPMLDKALGLTAAEHSRLLELFALHQIEMQEKHFRCITDPACNPHEMSFDDREQQQQITALLGQERAQQFDGYRNSIGERESITQLRNRLTDSQRLSDQNTEGLIAALAEERANINREQAQRGSGVQVISVGAGMLFSPMEGSLESQFAAAQQYSQRLRDRAAGYLNAEQLRVFNEIQDEQLVALRGMLRNKDGYSAVTATEADRQ